MQQETAKKISAIMLDASAKLDESVAIAQSECTDEELVVYRRAVGNILGEIWDTVLRPLYEEHPTLRPPGLDEEDEDS
jgi:hypothetical protein